MIPQRLTNAFEKIGEGVSQHRLEFGSMCIR